METKNFRPYFQSQLIIILTNLPLRAMLHNPNLFQRMVKWVTKLSDHGIQDKPSMALKREVLVDFIVELPQAILYY